MSISGEGETRVREAVGIRDGDRFIRKIDDGTMVCLQAEGDVEFSDDMSAIESIRNGGRVLLATVSGDDVAEMEISGLSPQQVRWTVNGQTRTYDAAAREWRESLMLVLSHQWNISTIRGEVSSLRGEMSSVRGRMSSLRGELSSLRGEASSIRGRISSVHGDASSLRGEISSLRGQVSSMRGEISSHHGAISSLRSERYRASAEEAQSIDQEIAEHEAAIEAVEQRIAEFDLESRVEAVERQIEGLGVDGQIEELQRELEEAEFGERMEEIQRRIEAYEIESEGEIERLQRRIEEMNASERIEAIEAQLGDARDRLERALRAIR
jgi:chromosome segregation ATPase